MALYEIAAIAIAVILIHNKGLRALLLVSVAGLICAYNSRSAIACWRLLMGLVVIEAIAQTFQAKDLKRLFTCWRIITIIHTGYMLLYQAIGLDPLFAQAGGGAITVAGLMDSNALAGAYTAMTLPLFFEKRYAWFILPSLLAVALSASFGAVVIAVVMLAWGAFLFLRPKRLCAALLAGLLLFVVGYSHKIEPVRAKIKGEKLNRIIAWEHCFMLMNENWRTRLIGQGPGQFLIAFRRESKISPELGVLGTMPWGVAHNEPLQAAVEFGAITASVCLLTARDWIVQALKTPDERFKRIGLIASGWVMCSFYYFPAHVVCLAVVFIVCAGIMESGRISRDLNVLA